MQPPRCTCDDNLKGIGPCPVHGLVGRKTYEEADCCTYCGGDLGLIRMCSNCIEKCRKAQESCAPSGQDESALLSGSGKNRYGLDADYFVKEFAKLTRDIDNYTPLEMHRYLERLSDAAI